MSPERDVLMNEDHSSYLRLVQDQARDGAFNMAVDEFLLRNQIQRKDPNSILRFYRFNEPTVTVGYGMWQALGTEMNNQIPLIRRITGGGMVVHGKSDLTYSLIVPLNRQTIFRKVRNSYYLIHEELRNALGHFGIATELFDQNIAVFDGFGNNHYGAWMLNDLPGQSFSALYCH